jgi:hypothetical protein
MRRKIKKSIKKKRKISQLRKEKRPEGSITRLIIMIVCKRKIKTLFLNLLTKNSNARLARTPVSRQIRSLKLILKLNGIVSI